MPGAASSKVAYEGRLRRMEDQRWARRVSRYMGFKSTQTAWTSRVRTLSRKFGFLAQPIHTSGTQKLTKVVRQRVGEAECEQWRFAMLDKSTLELYRTHKSFPPTENFFDNDAGSRLLFEARAGDLRTLIYRQCFDTSRIVKSTVYRACGEAAESAIHLITECVGVSPAHREDTSLAQALGFETHDCVAPHMVVTTTKERLRQWWWLTQQPDRGAAKNVRDDSADRILTFTQAPSDPD
ncbi:hypothetical protein HPB52_004081 [Rhipicephalus sanguineus]|uniref:Uncharacterized protein n=1 Tax=Rhipicephalus sanguineus TaxID=34632 RepID=A0A9D4QGZ1_RHISA|nr:hypothetical protein HPB52_004081 [Rhipicephalus sanguineus]